MAKRGEAKRICLGVVAGAHGLHGLVKIKSFTEVAEDIAAYGELSDEAGERAWRVEVTGPVKGGVLARLSGVEGRDAAEALRGTRLYVERARLPQPEAESYYHADLLGLRVETPEGRLLGRVKALHDFGAGDVLEVQGESGPALFLPFTRAVVPLVDLERGRLVVEPPGEA
jgi:16S rRNA processing protein RimM